MFGYYGLGLYWDPSMLLLIPGILLAVWAQAKVKNTYAKYSQVYSRGRWTGAVMARKILDDNGLFDVPVQRAPGAGLSDHYDPKARVLRLSAGVHDSSSLAALGIAAHEAGHALQHADSYVPIKVRNAIVPVARIGTYAAWPLLIIGLLFGSPNLAVWGVVLFSFAVLFQLVTLPVEYNASNRAVAILGQSGYLTDEELPGAKKVLNAAALTYLAAALMSVLQLLRLLSILGIGRRND